MFSIENRISRGISALEKQMRQRAFAMGKPVEAIHILPVPSYAVGSTFSLVVAVVTLSLMASLYVVSLSSLKAPIDPVLHIGGPAIAILVGMVIMAYAAAMKRSQPWVSIVGIGADTLHVRGPYDQQFSMPLGDIAAMQVESITRHSRHFLAFTRPGEPAPCFEIEASDPHNLKTLQAALTP